MPDVLIADDEPAIRDVITEALLLEGYDAHAVSNGVEALEFLERERVDLLVSDVLMPKLNGFQVVAALRRRGDFTPVVLMSAVVREALGLSQVVFLRKPFDLNELMAAVAQAINSHGFD